MQGLKIYEQVRGLPNFPDTFPMLTQYATPVKYMTRPLIGREKQLRQLKAGLMRPELCNVLLLGDAGSGKSVKNGSLIPVADARGYVKIEDLKIGDYVFDENGQPVEVLGVYLRSLSSSVLYHYMYEGCMEHSDRFGLSQERFSLPRRP